MTAGAPTTKSLSTLNPSELVKIVFAKLDHEGKKQFLLNYICTAAKGVDMMSQPTTGPYSTLVNNYLAHDDMTYFRRIYKSIKSNETPPEKKVEYILALREEGFYFPKDFNYPVIDEGKNTKDTPKTKARRKSS